MIIFDRTDKNNTSFETVKGLLSFVYTHNVNTTLYFCKIKKTEYAVSLNFFLSEYLTHRHEKYI